MNVYDLVDFLERERAGKVIIDSFGMTYAVMNQEGPAAVSISGGADSDIMLDLCTRLDPDNKLFTYIFCNTGLEYKATREHIGFLEQKYGISINTIHPKTPVVKSVRTYGQPFLSKVTSEYIERLQVLGFEFDKYISDEDVKNKYGNAGMWWSGNRKKLSSGMTPMFSVYKNPYLKEFLHTHKPTFKISAKCCNYTKKKPLHDAAKELISYVGVRKAEGGVRANTKQCLTISNDKRMYRPIFWYTYDDKCHYEDIFNVQHSRCYAEYGLSRTGCAGCPFNPNIDEEIDITKKYEPEIYKAADNIFHESYEYTRMYNDFVIDYRKMLAFQYLVRHPLLINKNATHK